MIYSNLSPSTKEPLVSRTSIVPLTYALAPIVVSKFTSITFALAPVLTPTVSKLVARFDRPVFCWNVTRN